MQTLFESCAFRNRVLLNRFYHASENDDFYPFFIAKDRKNLGIENRQKAIPFESIVLAVQPSELEDR